jgi:putative ABC transport system permease protein
VAVVGCDPASMLGNAWTMKQGEARAIREPDAVVIDTLDTHKLGNVKVGDMLEINGKRARVAGLSNGIVGFTTNPYVFTTMERARRDYTVGVPAGHCSYYLVKCKPGTDVNALCRKIQERVPQLDAHPKETLGLLAMHYWLMRTGIGLSFGLAALLGLLVGVAVVAQTLYGSVTERLREFATLKALGASEGTLLSFLMAQASGVAATGALLGLLVSWLLSLVLSTPRAAIILTWEVAALSALMIFAVCLVAAWLPYRRLRAVDPASVLRS